MGAASDFLKEKFKIGGRYAKKGAKSGFFHILGGNTLVQTISAIAALFYPLVMGKEDYATFSAAKNVLNYLLIFNGFGLINGILRYCAVFDKPEDKKSYFVFAVKFGLWSDVVIIGLFGGGLALLNSLKIYTLPQNCSGILAILVFTSALTYIFNALQYYLRANRENKLFSSTSVIFSAAYAGFQMVMALLFKFFGAVMIGAAIGQYIAFIVAIVYTVYMMRGMHAFRVKANKLSREEKRNIIKYSANYMIANSFSQLMPTNESMLVSNMVSRNDFGDFTAAQLVPSSTTFISNAVMIYIFPYFAKNYRDGKWVYRNTKRLVIGMTALMVVVTLLGMIFAPEIVLIFGKKFQTPNAVKLMRLFFIAYGISGAVRMPVGNILAAVGEVKFNIINSAITFVIHLILCWYLTANYGIGGAAYGLLTGYAVSAVIAYMYLKYYCKKIERQNETAQNNGKIDTDEKDLL